MTKGRFILKGKVTLLSPALIGCGKDDHSDIDLLRDHNKKPFIPATSFIGVLKHIIRPSENKDEVPLKKFWGFAEGQTGQQSSISCSNLYCHSGNPKTTIRDGIKIISQTGTVKKEAKYDYEIIERGTQFDLCLEINFNDEDSKKFSQKMLTTICDILKDGKIYIGAKTNSGLGKMELSERKVFEFDFGNKRDVLLWLTKKIYSRETSLENIQRLPIKGTEFIINTTFLLKNSLIVRSYPSDPLMPDAVHIQSGGNDVLPGTSLKGAIRSRAERILNTIFNNDTTKSEGVLVKLFGDVDDEKRSKDAVKGRISIDEVVLPKFETELQTRIKIDRFTGGTIESALFETMPLFADGDKNKQIKNVKITITIRDYKDHEAGLILLVLKDLWTGDLAVGGEKAVGRGVFEGVGADITWNNTTVTLEEGLAGLSSENKKQLENFVSALKDFKEKAHERS